MNVLMVSHLPMYSLATQTRQVRGLLTLLKKQVEKRIHIPVRIQVYVFLSLLVLV